MAYIAYAYYNIWFSDQSDYDFAVAVAGGNIINMAPQNAGALFGIPYPYPTGDMTTIDKTITFNMGFSPGDEINNPYPSGIFLDDSVDTVTVPGQAGVPAAIFPAGPALQFTWSGLILRLNSGIGESPAVTTLAQRRWINGVEIAPLGEGGAANRGTMCRVASRTNGGHGFAIRGQNVGGTFNHSVSEFRTGLITATSWERFYFRLRVAGSSTCGLWASHGFPSSGAGAGLEINTDGSIRVEMIDAVGTKTVVGTIPALDLNRWYRFDIFLLYADPPGIGTNGRIVVHIDGVLVFSYQDTTGLGLGGGTRHVSSDLGKWTGTVDNQIEYDWDDWINADLPLGVDATTLTWTVSLFPLDWLVGSHVRSVLTISATSVGWAPTNREALNQGNASTNLMLNISQMLSTTSGAIIDGLTDHNNDQDEIAQKIGTIAAVIADNSINPGALDGEAGYSIAGGAPVLTAIPQTGIFLIHAVAYFPSGVITPVPDITPFHVVKKKSLDVSQDTTTSLQAVVEYLGGWGPEDGSDIPEISTQDFVHNCRYTGTLWGYLGGYTDGPVMAIGGTYVGNGTFQDINLPYPCHFLIIRPLTGGSAGIRFFGSSVGPCRGDTDQNVPNVRVWMDANGQTKFTVSGVDSECNANAVTFQYIAFCDPGMRYNICGAYNHPQAGTSPRTNDISYISPDWLPTWAWVQSEVPCAASSTIGLCIKGPSSIAGVNGVTNRGIAIAQFGSFAVGQFNSRSGVHFNTGAQNNYSLWRKADAICGDVMLQIFSYVGNGVASRVIPFPDVTGRFPLFAHVQPNNSTVSIFRDPSHAGANSSLGSTMANTVNGITAGAVDSITVGSLLNTNLVAYDVFIILGSNIGWLNGTFGPPDCEGAYEPPARPPLPEIALAAEGGLTLGGTTAITLLRDVSGIYTLIPGKTNDTLIDRQTGVASVDVKIPDPIWKTGYIGG